MLLMNAGNDPQSLRVPQQVCASVSQNHTNVMRLMSFLSVVLVP
jgi:hypothetical protein